jgi:CheY-like chemotaxis protein
VQILVVDDTADNRDLLRLIHRAGSPFCLLNSSVSIGRIIV